MFEIKPNEAIKSVQIKDVVSYLVQKGWRQTEHPNEKIFVFTGELDDEGFPIKLVLPRKLTFDDSYLRLSEAINLLASLQDESPYQVVREIKGENFERKFAFGANIFSLIVLCISIAVAVGFLLFSRFIESLIVATIGNTLSLFIKHIPSLNLSPFRHTH
jgi:hypothetical protein